MREVFTEEHEAFRQTVRAFIDREIAPHHDQWEKDGVVSREVWQAAGKRGLLGFAMDEGYGGGGTDDFRYNVALNEELALRGFYGAAFPLFNDMIAPYFTSLATEEQKQRWFAGLCSGDLIAAIAMTEPGAGSDLQGIRTTAVDKGDHFVLNGSKTFISNGILGDLVVVVARTNPDAGVKGISLLVVERGMDGFDRGRNLDKIGQHAQDTAELFFDNVAVPKAPYPSRDFSNRPRPRRGLLTRPEAAGVVARLPQPRMDSRTDQGPDRAANPRATPPATSRIIPSTPRLAHTVLVED